MQASRSIEEIFDRVAATTLDLNGWQGHAISISDLRTLRNALLRNPPSLASTASSDTAFTPSSSRISVDLSDPTSIPTDSRESLTEGFLVAIALLDQQIADSIRRQALADPRDRPTINHQTGALQSRRADLVRRLKNV